MMRSAFPAAPPAHSFIIDRAFAPRCLTRAKLRTAPGARPVSTATITQQMTSPHDGYSF